MGLLAAFADCREAEQACPRPFARWTNPQQSWFDSPYEVTVAWGCNGAGKTVAAAEILTRGIEGSLHWQSGPGPRTVIVTGQTWKQLGVLLKHFMDGRGATYLKPGLRFEAGRMQGQRTATFDIVAGPGKGGQLIAATFTAGAKNIAGPRAELVVSDEPIPEPVYNELIGRGFGRRGRIYIFYTPTLGTSVKLGYLWEAVDDPAKPWVGEIQTPLSLDAVTPRGGIVEIPWATQDEIDRVVASWSPVERAMRMGLSRVPLMDTAYFGDVYGEHLISDARPPVGARLGIGIDHGSKPGAERVMLVAVDDHTIRARVWVLDEWSGSSKAGPKVVARAILDMLERAGCGNRRADPGPALWRSQLDDVDYWVGDRAHGGDRRGGAISNAALKEAFAEVLGIDTRRSRWTEKLPEKLARMWPPRKWTNSDYEGMAMLRRLMMVSDGEPQRLFIAAHCSALQTDLASWQGSRTDPHKDGLDALRYIVRALTEPPAGLRAA